MTTPIIVAQNYVRSVESKNLDAVAQTLAPNAKQLFMHTKRTKTAEGTADVISGRNRKAFCVAALEGREEILAYSKGVMGKFSPLLWRDAQWSAGGKQVFFSGKGDMVVERSGKPYRNNYVTIFELEGDKIVRMLEYADAFMYAGLGIAPNGAELRSFLHAVKYMFSSNVLSGNHSSVS